ncbi:MAG: hypothetical protein ACRYFZ_10740 [Janthinobacterium lividum]
MANCSYNSDSLVAMLATYSICKVIPLQRMRRSLRAYGANRYTQRYFVEQVLTT